MTEQRHYNRVATMHRKSESEQADWKRSFQRATRASKFSPSAPETSKKGNQKLFLIQVKFHKREEMVTMEIDVSLMSVCVRQ